MLQVQIKNGNNVIFVSEIYKTKKHIDNVKKLIDSVMDTYSLSCIELKNINGDHCYIPKTILHNNIITMCEY
ncbi:MAG: hypothetical protein ACOC33_03350 [bacterium]